jgi:hypothetical protein
VTLSLKTNILTEVIGILHCALTHKEAALFMNITYRWEKAALFMNIPSRRKEATLFMNITSRRETLNCS